MMTGALVSGPASGQSHVTLVTGHNTLQALCLPCQYLSTNASLVEFTCVSNIWTGKFEDAESRYYTAEGNVKTFFHVFNKLMRRIKKVFEMFSRAIVWSITSLLTGAMPSNSLLTGTVPLNWPHCIGDTTLHYDISHLTLFCQPFQQCQENISMLLNTQSLK